MLSSMRKIAVFDFCETIANFQTADPFVFYTLSKYGTKKQLRKKRFLEFLNKYRIIPLLHQLFPSISLNKKLVLSLLKGMPEDIVEKAGFQYYNEIVRTNFIQLVIEIIKRKKIEGFEIALASGGYDVYLKHFAEEFSIDSKLVVCSRIGFKNGLCTGHLIGKDCMRGEKVIRLSNMRKDDCYIEAYSDSKSDLPLLLWADKAFIVERSDKNKNWNNQFTKIKWEN